MQLESRSFANGQPIPEEFAFARPDPHTHATFAANRNPHLSWKGVPKGTKSLVLLCVDPDAPSIPDDVCKEGRIVPRDLPRVDFHHWVMVDIPPTCSEIAAGSFSSGVTPGGKQTPKGPQGSRQGRNDYTSWFAADPEMAGQYLGYDGPAPPWNDEREHRYRFELIASDLERCPVEGAFTAQEVRRAIAGHDLARASLTGTYTLSPGLASRKR